MTVDSQEAVGREPDADPRAERREPGSRPAAAGATQAHRRASDPDAAPGSGCSTSLPGLVLYALVVIVPVGQGVWLSFFHWNGVTAATWAGLSQLHRLPE